MKSMKKNLNVSAVVLIAVLLSIVAYQAGANRITSPANPATVAVVNLPAVLEGLAQRSEAEMDLRNMGTAINAEREKRETEIRRLGQEHDQLRRQSIENPDLTPEADAIEERLVYEELRYRAWMEFTSDQVDLEQALILQDLYRVTKRAINQLAETEGYDLVLVDDGQGELMINPESRASRTAQIEQQMLARVMLYTNPAIDITNNLIERMNNAYRAGNASR